MAAAAAGGPAAASAAFGVPEAAPPSTPAAAPAAAPTHTAAAPAAALSGDALARVLAALPRAEDLLHAGRVCRAWRAAVEGGAGETAWRALCASHGYALRPGGGPARAQFRRRHEQVLKDRRLKRRVELLTARSAVAGLEREIARLTEQRAAEVQANRRRRSEAASAARLAQARSAMQGWQLGVVQAAHERLTQPQPVQAEWRLNNLQHSIKESDAHLRHLDRALHAKRAQLAAAKRRLDAMAGS